MTFCCCCFRGAPSGQWWPRTWVEWRGEEGPVLSSQTTLQLDLWMSPSNISYFHFWWKREIRHILFLFRHYTSPKQTSVCICTGHIAVFGVYYRKGFFVWHEEHVEGYKIYRCLYKRYLSPTQGTIRRYNRHKIWVKPHSETSYGFLTPGPQYRLDHNWNIYIHQNIFHYNIIKPLYGKLWEGTR